MRHRFSSMYADRYRMVGLEHEHRFQRGNNSMKTLLIALTISICSSVAAAQQFSSVPGQGRSMVVTKLGIVAAPQFLASQAGAHILEQGGNAVDAAIAANAVMGVVQPYVNGMGGDLFALYYDAKANKLYGLNASGWTPKALTIVYLKSHGVSIRSIPLASKRSIFPVLWPGGMRCAAGSVSCPSPKSSRRRSTMHKTGSRWPREMRAIGLRRA